MDVKRIISGKMYSTKLAKCVASCENRNGNNVFPEALYLKKQQLLA